MISHSKCCVIKKRSPIYLIIGFGIIFLVTSTIFIASVQDVAADKKNQTDDSLDLDENNLFGIRDFSLTTATFETDNHTWIPIYGDKFYVEPGEIYTTISHLRLNDYAIQSHIVISGFNESSEEWSQILQCPSGMDGPMDLNRFVCKFTVPNNITQLQPIFQTGWSNKPGQKAETMFGKFFIIKEPDKGVPIIYDSNLKAQEIFSNNLTSTAMKFIGLDDILLTDAHNGTVYRYLNGTILGPLTDFNTARDGLTGLESLEINGTRYVYLFLTESGGTEDGDDLTKGIDPKCNCLYRFELHNDTLTDKKLLFSVPAYLEGNGHSAGIMRIDKNNNVFLMIGSLDAENKNHELQLINNEKEGKSPDGRSGILRFSYDGEPVKGILGDSFPLNLYYAYGIRNGFGMDFDPVTGKLWDTENGPELGDEINLVEPGFNSGFSLMNGIWKYGVVNNEKGYLIPTLNPTGLVNFSGNGIYRSPELSWERTVGVVALSFLNSTKLGEHYTNSMFISDFNNDNIYNFNLNADRSELDLFGPLSDKVVNSTNIINNYQEINSNLFATGMGFIVDIKTGPDGFLYFLKMNDGAGGKLYRIIPDDNP